MRVYSQSSSSSSPSNLYSSSSLILTSTSGIYSFSLPPKSSSLNMSFHSFIMHLHRLLCLMDLQVQVQVQLWVFKCRSVNVLMDSQCPTRHICSPVTSHLLESSILNMVARSRVTPGRGPGVDPGNALPRRPTLKGMSGQVPQGYRKELIGLRHCVISVAEWNHWNAMVLPMPSQLSE